MSIALSILFLLTAIIVVVVSWRPRPPDAVDAEAKLDELEAKPPVKKK